MGSKYVFGKKAFISYRSKHYDYAKTLKAWIEKNQGCKEGILFKPGFVSPQNEIHTTYRYFELMEGIIDYLARSDAFLFLDIDLKEIDPKDSTGGYWDSYFTQAEVLQWRRFKKQPMAHRAVFSKNDNGEVILSEERKPYMRVEETEHYWEPLTKEEKKVWAKISTNINPKLRNTRIPVFLGKYATGFYLIHCGDCGEHFLCDKRIILDVIDGKENINITCPHCPPVQKRIINHYFNKIEVGKIFKNIIIIYNPIIRKRIRLLTTSELISLLIDNELPPLIKMALI